MGWEDDDAGFGNSGFSNSGFSSGANKSSFGKSSGFGSSAPKTVSFNKSSSNPRPNNSGGSSGIGWKPKVKDWEPVSNLNKMISVHNIPFFGQTQAFMGKTLWDWFKRSKAHFSDIIDRLNCHVVPMFLMFFVMFISANIFGAFGMEPMRCLRSPELNDEEREYALDYCQSKNTYYVAPEEGIPWSNKERRERQLGYYHWVPIMMFLQAMLFMLPNWLWNALNQQSGIEFIKFIEESTRLKHLELNNQERPSLVHELSERMSEAILNRDVFYRRRIAGCRVGQCMGSYVSMLYIGIKLLYLVNVATQFLVLNSFIGINYGWWGVEVLKALINSENWQDSPIFPRLTLCDVPIRRLGDTPRYTLQCHLRINTYNEKIYLFIWWGFLLVAGLTLVNFFYYFFVLILLPCTQEGSVRHLLKQDRHESIVYSTKKQDKKLIKKFAEHALCKDGVLLFWFIESHAGPIVARELLGEIFESYKQKVHYEEDPSEVEIKKGKSSFSSKSTGSIEYDEDEDNWEGGGGDGGAEGGGPHHRFAPSAPPKFVPGESASFSSSQERELIDGDAETTESSNLYSSTPKTPGTAYRNQKMNGRKHSNYDRDYNERDRHTPGIFSRVFRWFFGGGGGGNYYRNQHQPLGGVPFTTASYYGRAPIKNV